MVIVTAILVGGYPIYREAFEALRERRMTMELSMTIALIAALSIREAFTAVVIVLFVLVAEVLARTKAEGIKPPDPDEFSYTPGKGIVCSPRGSRFLGALEVADVVRPEAAAAIAEIRRMGMRTVLLTGGATSIAQEVGSRLGVDEVCSWASERGRPTFTARSEDHARWALPRGPPLARSGATPRRSPRRPPESPSAAR
jgi:cation transport ATPase